MRRFIAFGVSCVLLAACQPKSYVKNHDDPTNAPRSTEWITINGLLGMNISFPEYFSLEKNINEFQQDVTLTNNRDMGQGMSISAFDVKRLQMCKQEKFPKQLAALNPQKQSMDALAHAIRDINAMESSINDFTFAGTATGVSFSTAQFGTGSILLPCSRLSTINGTNVVLIPTKDILYTITYNADVPLLDDIAKKLEIRENTK